MKYDNIHYYEAPRMFWPVDYTKKYDPEKKHNEYKTNSSDKYKRFHELSVYAKWLYQTLKECEHRYTGHKNDQYTVMFLGVDNPKGWFYIGIEKLSYMSGISVSQIKRAKNELLDAGLIRNCTCHLIEKKTEKRTTIHVTGYRIYSEEELEFKKQMF